MKQEYIYYEQPCMYGLKHYKKDELEFDYIDKKIRKRKNNMKVIGAINPKKQTYKKNREQLFIESQGKEYVLDIKHSFLPSLGYLEVGKSTYVSIVNPNCKVWCMLLVVLCLGIALMGYFDEMKTVWLENEIVDEFLTEDGEDIMYENPIEKESVQETITIPGYANIRVSSESPSVSLINPAGNTVYMKYIILNGEEIIYETKAFASDKMVRVNMKELLCVGKHNLTFMIQTFDMDTQESCNGATQKVTVWVEE